MEDERLSALLRLKGWHRRRLLQVRKRCFAQQSNNGELLRQRLQQWWSMREGREQAQRDGFTVGGYIPMGSEIDVLPALRCWFSRGGQIALPCVPSIENATEPLRWRLWIDCDPGRLVSVQGCSLRQPDEDAPEIQVCTLSLVLVPLVGVDYDGIRLGMGGGWYDRTFWPEASCGNPLLVGVGFDGQLSAIPFVFTHTDVRLGWLATSSRVMRFTGARN